MISHKHRCIFVHVPKCAGSSIEEVIWPMSEGRSEADLWMGFVRPMHNKYQTGGLQHLLARQIRQEVGAEVFSAYFKFGFVRNPWDRAVSQYVYMARRPDLRNFVGLPDAAPFEHYLERIGTRRHVQWEPQFAFLHDDDGTPLVDFVGRFETFQADAKAAFARLGIAAEAPHTNRSRRAPYRSYYDAATRQRVAELYRDDIAAFGYAF